MIRATASISFLPGYNLLTFLFYNCSCAIANSSSLSYLHWYNFQPVFINTFDNIKNILPLLRYCKISPNLLFMKKIILLLAPILLTAPFLHAQVDGAITKKIAQPANHKNLIKLNLLALGLKNITVQYERKMSKKTTLAIGLRMMPKSGLPYESSFHNAIKDSSTQNQLDNFKTGNFAFMPEIRFYMSRKGAYHGFYIAPFFSYAHYTADLPYNYTDNGTDKTIPLSGGINTITGGLMFGAQWKIGKSVYLDWWIFGPHYGSSKGSISGAQSLSPSEQSSLKSNMDNLNVPLVKTTNVVDANGATLDFTGPWAGIRSGLCIGFRF